MLIFSTNDYSEGAHPNILRALAEKNHIQQEGYGDDDYCKKAEWFEFLSKPQSNQIFPLFTNTIIKNLTTNLDSMFGHISTKKGQL